MSDDGAIQHSGGGGLFPERGALRLLVLCLFFFAAVGIRIYRLKEPPLEVHVGRQHHSAIIARAWYFEGNDSIPQWRQRVASANKEATGLREPPLMELLSVLGYRLAGGEHLWIPRLLSIVFWTAGGVFLYQLVKGSADADAAVLSTLFYLFVPFGVSSSRTFMPDPLMVALFVVGTFLLWRYFDRPSIGSFVVATAASASAVFVKSFCLLPLVCVFVCLSVRKKQASLHVMAARAALFAILVLVPVLLYLLYMSVTAQAEQILLTGRAVFQPSLLIRPFFWAGWLAKISQVVTLPAFLAAVVGIVIFRKGMPRALVFGLFLGYFVYGLAFSYPAYTHHYYHLQLVPIVAISLGPAAAGLMRCLVTAIAFTKLRRAYVCSVVLAAVVLAAFSYVYGRRTLALRRLSGPQRRSQSFVYAVNPDFQDIVREAQEIGKTVGQSSKTIMVYPSRIYCYHGDFAGKSWPDLATLRAWKQRGRPELTARERFDAEYAAWSPEYFVIVNLVELDAQPDLAEFLARNHRLVRRTDTYIIYDLRQRGTPAPQTD